MPSEDRGWPSLPLAEWRDTYATLHLWTQIVGKIRLACTPPVNHWWNVPLYVDARGLTTSLMSFGSRGFEMRIDFHAHELVIETTDGSWRTVALAPRTVADFYADVMAKLRSLGIDVRIWPMPVELPDPVSFESDTLHRSYDPEYARRLFDILVSSQRVFERFRSLFLGKCSPIHFFWGGFDLAVTRFSGRAAPLHPPVPNLATRVVREAYSQEVSSAGFCPGYGPIEEPFFFSYAYPEPREYPSADVEPPSAYYDGTLGEYVVPYEAIRTAASPDEALFAFLDTTYTVAAELGDWERHALERDFRHRRLRSSRAPQPGAPRSGAQQ